MIVNYTEQYTELRYVLQVSTRYPRSPRWISARNLRKLALTIAEICG